MGIEFNAYAAELARVVIWIGEIQWMLANGFAYLRDPILKPLDSINEQDAVLDLSDPASPEEPVWPEATVIIGNPPFIGGKLMRANLGDHYVDALFATYDGRVPREADFVCYWHEKARAMVEEGRARRVGLLATQGIRGGANRRVLEHIKVTGDIFLAWSDEPWVLDGAAVHISFLGFDDGSEQARELNGMPVASINANLTSGIDLTLARRLPQNRSIAFMGDTKGGAFDISAEVAERLLASPNPDGRSNGDVVRPWVNGLDITRRPRGMWIVDFGTGMPIEQAALYEAPFEYVREHVKPQRDGSRSTIAEWWLHERRREDMRSALYGLERYLATPRVTKHRLFVWLSKQTLADSALIVFARNDDYFFGLLHARPHEALVARSWHPGARGGIGVPLHADVDLRDVSLPGSAVRWDRRRCRGNSGAELDRLREGWLNPPDADSNELAKRTLTNLYNLVPTWLDKPTNALIGPYMQPTAGPTRSTTTTSWRVCSSSTWPGSGTRRLGSRKP